MILEGYGLTETSAASVVNRPDRVKFGTVGLPLPGTQLKIAEDGEILIKGPGVMDGYHRLAHETGQALVGDGWLATGDIGEHDLTVDSGELTPSLKVRRRVVEANYREALDALYPG